MSIGIRAGGVDFRLGRRARHLALPVLALCLMTAAGLAGGASAQVLIDDFSTGPASISLQDPPDVPGDTQGANQAGAGMIGGQRDLFLTWIAGGIGPVSTDVAGGSLLFSTTADSDASVLATWDGDTDPNNLSATGLGNVDLTAGGTQSALRLTVDSADAGIELILTVYTDAADFSNSALVLPTTGAATDFFFPFASFVADPGGSGADFTDVGAVSLLVRGAGTHAGSALFFSGANLETAAPSISALQADQPGTPAAPGDTITFEATVQNTGGAGQGVTFEETLDTNVTIVPGSVKTSPLARNDAFSGIGNVDITVAAPGLLANDVDLDDAGPSSLVVTTTGAIPTAQGGTATLAADGSFTYAPPPGFQGVDGFSYSIADDEAETDSAAAVINLDAIVWFVENDACSPHPCGSGTFADPFSSLKQAETASSAGHVIRLREGDGTTTNNDQGFIKKDGQHLIGSGVDLVVNGQTIETATNRPVMTHVAGNGIDLASENTIRGLNIAGSSGAALFGTGVGTVTVTEVDVTDSGGAALDVDGGTLAMTFGTLDSLSSSGHGIHLRNVGGSLTATTTNLDDPTDTGIRVATSAGASFDFGDTTITNAGDAGGADAGIDLATSGAATFTFSSLTSTTQNGAGLVANGSGTVNIGGTTNTITATGGPALDVTNTDLGTGWTFSSLTSSISPTEGIRLDTLSDPITVNSATVVNNADTTGILVQGSSSTSFDFGPTTVTDDMVGAGNTANGIDLLTGNTGASFTFDSLSVTTDGGFGLRQGGSTLSVGGGTNTINATGGAALDLTNTVISGTATFSSLSSSSSPGTGINLNGVTGGLTANGGSITGASGNSFDIAGGNGAVTYDGTINNTSGRAVEVTGRNSAGTHTISFGGAITETGTGINLDDNDVATIRFSGGLDLQTGASTAFSATNGGVVTVDDTAVTNTILTTTATALRISDTSIGTLGGGPPTQHGVTFRSISTNGAPSGIVLSNAGTGGFEITGDGATGSGTSANNDSGGSILNSTGDGIQLTNLSNVALDQVRLQDAADHGIDAQTVTNLTVTRANLVSNGNANEEHGLRVLSGSGSLTANNIFADGNFDSHIRVFQQNGMNLGAVTIDDGVFRNVNTGSFEDGITISTQNLGANITSIAVTNNDFDDHDGDHLQVASNGTATIGSLVISGNTMNTSAGTVLGGGITINHADSYSGSNTVTISSNNIQDAAAQSVNINIGGHIAPALVKGTISGNIIGTAGNAGSGGNSGIDVEINGNPASATAGTLTVLISGNTVREFENIGIDASAIDGNTNNAVLNATITGNTITEALAGGGPFSAVFVDSQNGNTNCLDLGGAGALENTFATTGFADVAIRTNTSAVVNLEGYGGAANDGTAIQTYIQGRNAGSPSVIIQPNTGTIQGGGACPVP